MNTGKLTVEADGKIHKWPLLSPLYEVKGKEYWEVKPRFRGAVGGSVLVIGKSRQSLGLPGNRHRRTTAWRWLSGGRHRGQSDILRAGEELGGVGDSVSCGGDL